MRTSVSFRQKLLFSSVFMGVLPVGCHKSVNDSCQPNIVLILADDLGYGDISALNADSKITTPAIDGLVKEGITFTDAHSGSSVCTPTRYGILTGQYCWRSRIKKGVLLGYSPSLIEPDTPTIAGFLKSRGYSTACIGKWHLGIDWKLKDGTYLQGERGVNFTQELIRFNDHEKIDFPMPAKGGPLGAGFDYSFVIPASLDFEPYCFVENNKVTEPPSAYTGGNCLSTGATGAFWRAGQMAPGFVFEEVLPLFTGKAASYIISRRNQKNPFFLYLPLNAPHTPWVPVQNFRGTSGAGEYGDFVSQVDNTVGQIITALDECGLKENTLLIFTSDNGAYWKSGFIEKFGHRSNFSFRGMKSDAWEGGHHIPFIARWPGRIEKGKRCAATICLTDLFDTFREITGETGWSSKPVDSFSFLPLLLGKERTMNRPPVIHHSGNGKFAIRDGEWKYIEGLGSGGFSEPVNPLPGPGEPDGQLYNLSTDPQEQDNVYFMYPEKVAAMKQQLGGIRGQTE